MFPEIPQGQLAAFLEWLHGKGHSLSASDLESGKPELASWFEQFLAAQAAAITDWKEPPTLSRAIPLPVASLDSPPGRTPRAVTLPMAFGRYRLDQLLGSGGMGEVYLAYDTQLHRFVALKIPLLSGPGTELLRARFQREARAAASLAHPNICPIFDLGEVEGVWFLTMPLIAGQPLNQWIDPQHLPAEIEAVTLVRKVALALEEAHSQGIIHRDLKPSNIMINERGEPLIMDFGLARRCDAADSLTLTGEIVGTPSYMSPEQFAGDSARVGPAADIYALGAILYEVLTGNPPFKGDLFSLANQVRTSSPVPPSQLRPGLNPRLEEVCLKAMANRPEDRWPSMRALANALETWLEGLPVLATPCAGKPVSPTNSVEVPLTLRVEGTPYVFRPAPGQELISLGRQKRKPGGLPDEGNDLVLRVLGNDQLSSRISRRHLEIKRQEGGFVVIDRSKAGTWQNGKPLTRDVPSPLAHGDRLTVAGVLTLEVQLHEPTTVGPSFEKVTVAPANRTGPAALLEVSVGDLVTTE